MNGNDFVTRDELDEVIAELEAINRKLDREASARFKMKEFQSWLSLIMSISLLVISLNLLKVG